MIVDDKCEISDKFGSSQLVSFENSGSHVAEILWMLEQLLGTISNKGFGRCGHGQRRQKMVFSNIQRKNRLNAMGHGKGRITGRSADCDPVGQKHDKGHPHHF